MTSKTAKILAENLRKFRVDAGYRTREEFSKKTGLDIQMISSTELARSFPRVKALEQMAKACGVSVFEFLMPKAELEAFRSIKELARGLKVKPPRKK